MGAHEVVLIPGDGIGPEIARVVRTVLAATEVDIRWTEERAGLDALAAGEREVLPARTLEAIRRVGVALKGPCTTPVAQGFASVNVQLRRALDLYAAVRPVRSVAGVDTRFTGVDIVVFRENTEGLYCAIENEIVTGVFTSVKVATVKACERIARAAFRHAVERRRRKVTVFHKANILKLTDGVFLRCARRIHDEEFSGVGFEDMILDAGCMRLVQEPERFDVLLLENLYGDVVSDLCAGLAGGLGVAPGANIGDGCAVFEAVHGSAPDIAGKGVANPLAFLLSAALMLEHLALTRGDPACARAAASVRDACLGAVASGSKTRDLGGALGTEDFGCAVIERLERQPVAAQ